MNTEVRREAAQQTAGAMSHLADDLVGQRMAFYSFEANLKTVQTQSDMLGTLLDTQA